MSAAHVLGATLDRHRTWDLGAGTQDMDAELLGASHDSPVLVGGERWHPENSPSDRSLLSQLVFGELAEFVGHRDGVGERRRRVADGRSTELAADRVDLGVDRPPGRADPRTRSELVVVCGSHEVSEATVRASGRRI